MTSMTSSKALSIKHKRPNVGLIALAIPGLIFLVLIYFVPLFGLVIPFKSMNYSKGIFGSDWIQPIYKNFEFFFKSQDAWIVTRNTIGMNAIFIFLTLILSVLFAIFLYELSSKSVKVFQTCMFVPYFISWVVAGYVLYAILCPDMGVIPKLIGKGGPNFYNDTTWWPLIMTLSYLWKGIGYNTLLYYATLIGMDSSQFEAAAIDGATKFQRTIHIELPYLAPTITMLILLQIGKIFYADFGMFYFLPRNSGSLYPVTDVIDTYVFRTLQVTGDIGMSSAMGLYQSIVGFMLVLISNLVVKKIHKEYALF
jgi:putative aldouronate transport system permease protein